MKIIGYLLVLMGLYGGSVFGVERFPPPEFESGHELPKMHNPEAMSMMYEYIDLGVLVGCLVFGAWLVHRYRRRWAIMCLAIFSIGYFGFYRKGCVCSIGAIQNVSEAVFGSGMAVSVVVAGFFILPLIIALIFGRVFCAGVCPLGAVQDLVVVKPIKIPRWLEEFLRFFVWVYLAVAVLFAATASGYIICRYDPIIPLFRLEGLRWPMVFAAGVLVLGMFVGRPYCRFACPYSVILRVLSRFAWMRPKITPKDCIQCRLCEDACPFGCIKSPSEGMEHKELKSARKKLVVMIVLTPLIIAASGWGAGKAYLAFSKANKDVRLAQRIELEDSQGSKWSDDSTEAFRSSGESVNDLNTKAAAVQKQHRVGAVLVGGFIGLIACLKIMKFMTYRREEDYRVDEAGCVACGRCFEYCPVEKDRRKGVSDKVD